MGLDGLPGDGEAQAALGLHATLAGLLPVTLVPAAPVALEHPRMVLGRETRPLVAHGEPGPRALLAPRHRDGGAAWADAERVRDEVRRGRADGAPVAGHGQRVGSAGHEVEPLHRGRAVVLGDQGPSLGSQVDDGSVTGAEREATVDGEVVHRAAHPLDGAACGRDAGGAVVVECRGAGQLEVGAGHGQRGAQLVDHLVQQPLLLAPLALQAVEHVVEAGRQGTQLVAPVQPGPLEALGAFDPVDDVGQPLDRAQETARHHPGEAGGRHERHTQHGQDPQHGVAPRVVGGGGRRQVALDAHEGHAVADLHEPGLDARLGRRPEAARHQEAPDRDQGGDAERQRRHPDGQAGLHGPGPPRLPHAGTRRR